jgi:hypothetical protein
VQIGFSTVNYRAVSTRGQEVELYAEPAIENNGPLILRFSQI